MKIWVVNAYDADGEIFVSAAAEKYEDLAPAIEKAVTDFWDEWEAEYGERADCYYRLDEYQVELVKAMNV